MFNEYVSDLARQMLIPLTEVSLVEGDTLGCLDMHLLKISSGDFTSTALVRQTDLVQLQSGHKCDVLETKIRSALDRLKVQIAP